MDYLPLPPVTLNDGSLLPAVGLGTYGLTGEPGVAALAGALDAGYRLLDTAVAYGNEAEVGEAVARASVPRGQITVTTKIRGRDHGYDRARRSIRDSRERLRTGQIDLCLIHWPNPGAGRYVEAWRALVDARSDGEVRAIGVSNFTRGHLERIIAATGVTPVLNQVEMHPYFPQAAQRAVHRELGIRTEAWSPLGRRGALFAEPAVTGAARRLGVTAAQVILRWHHQLGSVPIPKSASPDRQRQNLDLADFELSGGEMTAITALGRADGRLGRGDPSSVELM